jgi:hypothetical protein
MNNRSKSCDRLIADRILCICIEHGLIVGSALGGFVLTKIPNTQWYDTQGVLISSPKTSKVCGLCDVSSCICFELSLGFFTFSYGQVLRVTYYGG